MSELNMTSITSPPYLKRARLRNYRSIQDTKTSFKSGLNIIIGNNGSGKTNFINLIQQLINPYREQTEGLGCELTLMLDKEANIYFYQPAASQYQDNFHSQEISENQFLRTVISYDKQKSEGQDLEDAFYNITKTFSFLDYDLVPVKHGLEIQNLPIINSNTTMVFDNRGRVRLEGDANQIDSRSYSRLVNSIFSTIARTSVMKYRTRQANSAPGLLSAENIGALIRQVIDLYLSQLEANLNAYSPISQVRLCATIQEYHNVSQNEYLAKGIVLEYRVNEMWLPFSALSDGTKRLFYIISQLTTPSLATAEIGVTRTHLKLYNPNKIVLLEEPELGIHPDQLQKLLSLIREVSKEHQVIMTTHSPQVLNMLTTKELDRITICELDPKKGTQFRKLSPAKRAKAKAYMQNDSYLSDFWLYSNLEAE